ncbi:MAG: cupin domain-containing protein [Solirubrobacteraceae bacterium]
MTSLRPEGGDWVEDPTLRQHYRFQRSGGALRVEMRVDPGGGVTPHIHPSMEERFEVLSGRPEFLAGRRWRSAEPGDTVVVPVGVRHAFRNRGDEVAHIVCHATPPQSLQAFLEDAAGLGRARALTARGIPRSLDAALQGAVMAHHHRAMVVLLFPPMPPPPLQRLILPVLARLGARRGHRAGRFKELA